LQWNASGVADLVTIAALDQDECACSKRIAMALDDCGARSRLDEQPLIGSAMTIVRSTLAIARRNRHRRCLGAAVAEYDFEPLPKT